MSILHSLVAALFPYLGMCALESATVTVDTVSQGIPFVHRWKRSFGSGHASLTLRDDWRAHLLRARRELGMQGVRYHGLFDDDMGPVVTLDGGKFSYNWSLIDSTWDLLLANGIRPIVELSFMPAFVANCSWHGHCPQDPINCTGYWCTQCYGHGVGPIVNPTAPKCNQLEFHYQGIKQPPPGADYSGWSALVGATAEHAIMRYGLKEVQNWSFEVWNELWGMPFPDEYMALYAASAKALKAVHPSLKVGGPATAVLAKLPDFVQECKDRHVPHDFVSTHHYPTDGGCSDSWDPACFASQVRAARESVPNSTFYLTEYNVGCCLGYPLHDTSAAAAFVFRSVGDLNELLDVYSYWTFTDVFEEGGLPRIEFKNIYGAMTISGIPKPVWRSFQLLHTHAGDERLQVAISSESVNKSYIAAFATRNSTGSLDTARVFLSYWGNPDGSTNTTSFNTTVLIQHAITSVPRSATAHVITGNTTNPQGAWKEMGSPAVPNPEQLSTLMAASEPVSKAVGVLAINATTSAVSVLMDHNTAIVLELDVT